MSQKKFKIKKGDTVVVTTGRDKGISGEVLRVVTEDDKLFVQGVNLRAKHRKPTQGNPGGIEKIETPIHVSNVAIVDPKSEKASRVGYKSLKDGKKVRISKASGETLD